jgi:nucleotide-binding universal stress UspA family protein
MAADVKIDIAAEFTGKKAFKQAETATDKLTKNVKKLAGAVGLAYGTSAIIAYGKASVKAFAADEAAALRLNRAVTNLGIGFANPAIADYISKLEKSAGIADDVLRPAFQSLLTTTGSLTKSQELLNNAITISRASGVDLATVTEDLAKGYVGITKGLAKYNTGLTRAELTSKSFSDILGVLLTKSAGAAEDYLSSTAYSMNVLSIATGNASEIIGEGLVDAFARIGGGTEASDAAIAIEGIAKAISGITVATGTALGGLTNVVRTLKNLPKNIFQGFAGVQGGVNLGSVAPTPKLTVSQKKQQEALKALEAAAVKRNKELLSLKTKQLSIEKQTLTQKKLQAAIDKANLALGKGSDVFDMDKIQIAAALTSQAEQLGKATTSSQVLQIANDVARLNVKQSILALEDAIAAKDEAAIIAATNKLNADLKVLGTLGQQNLKLLDIKSILDTLKPKDLINISNLEEALRLLGLINLASTGSKTSPAGKPTATPAPSISGLTPATTIAETNANVAALGGVITQILPNLKEFTPDSGIISGISPNGREYNYSVTVNTGIGDPNAIAEAVTQVIQDAVDRGTLRGGSY